MAVGDHSDLQTPGAGPSQPRSSLPLPPPRAHVLPGTSALHARAPTRTDTLHQEVELGVYLQPDHNIGGAAQPPLNLSGIFERRGSASSVVSKFSSAGKSFFLANPTWRTDIVTFCSHARIDNVLGHARITHVQARKSRRPPFLHEYLLVFFTAARNQRFVMRIDRLGKVGSASTGWPLGWCAGRHGVAANTAVQEVGVYHIQDSQSGIDSEDGAWLEMDGRWRSYPIATLATWESLKERSETISHHVQTAAIHTFHVYVGGLMDYQGSMGYGESRVIISFRFALHSIIDVPLPLGVVHAYMTALEQKMSRLVDALAAQFLSAEAALNLSNAPSPEVLIDGPWATLAVWFIMGLVIALLLFVAVLFKYGAFGVFLLLLPICIWVNFKLGDSATGIQADGEGIVQPTLPQPESVDSGGNPKAAWEDLRSTGLL
ncbi:hypothetical protein FRC06_004461 [Ceratobasidium sp. 370]|nr:hypothetical protein FRC06_004461 [Ceratobasidium sp. 370]